MKLYYIFGIILVLAFCGCLENNEYSDIDNYSVDADNLAFDDSIAWNNNITIAIQKDNITNISYTNDTVIIHTNIKYME